MAALTALCLVLPGCGQTEEEVKVVTALEDGTRTLGFYSDGAALQNIPVMETKGFYSATTECNDSCHMATYNTTTKEEYDAYIDLLQRQGFTLCVDNTEHGIHEDVYYAGLQKDETTIHLVYQARRGCTYVIVGEKENLSEHLTDREEFRAGIREGIPNSLTMLDQANGQAMGMIFQLRNGHFLVIDGGMPANADNVLKYLKEMAPEGEKPVIEGWFLTHFHLDHYGVMEKFADREDMYSQIIIDGIYYNQPNAEHTEKTNSNIGGFTGVRLLALKSKDQNGETTKIYRTVMGQQYYFCDIVMDMINSTEFVPFANSDGDFNETDTVYVLNVDGQKVLINGDSEMGCMYNMMNSFRPEYMTWDIYQLTHHGYSSLREFFDYATYIKTVIDPSRLLVDSVLDNGSTLYLRDEVCEEFYYQGNDVGTIRMTFPYEVGQMEILGNDFDVYPTWDQIMFTQSYYLYIEG